MYALNCEYEDVSEACAADFVEYQSIEEISEGEFQLMNRTSGKQCEVATVIRIRTEDPVLKEILRDEIREANTKSSGGVITLWEDGWDPTNTFSAKLTITAEKASNTGTYPYWSFSSASVLITGASGTTGAYVGNNITLTGQTLEASCDGWNSSGHVHYFDSTYKTPTVRSWNYTPPGTWHPVYSANPDFLAIGGNLYVTYRIGTSSTIHTLTVNTQVF